MTAPTSGLEGAIPREDLARIKPTMLWLAADAASAMRREPSSGGKGPGDNQFRTLVQLCREADIPEEIDAYLGYQGGRRNRPEQEGWRPQDTKRMLEALKQLRDEATKLGLPKTPSVTLTLYAFFFGYVYWQVKAAPRGA